MEVATYLRASKLVGYIGGVFLGLISIVVFAVFLGQFRRAHTKEEKNRDLAIGLGVGGGMMIVAVIFILFSRFFINFSMIK